MRDKIKFEANVPVELSLAYPQGKFIDGQFGQQVMFGLQFPPDSVIFLDPGVAQKINQLEIQPSERFFICKRPKNGSTPARWDVWLSPATESMRAAKEIDTALPPEPPSLTERAQRELDMEAKLKASIEQAQPRKSPQSQPAAMAQTRGNGTTGPVPMPRPAAAVSPIAGLVAETNGLVDAFAECMERALSTYQGRIKPEEVRSLLLSAYIQRGKHA